MKRTLILFAFAIVMLSACNSDKSKSSASSTASIESTGLSTSDDGKTGSFKVDGANFNGKVSMQKFGSKETDQFSVLCQQDEPFALLQAIFANEKAADGDLRPADGFMSMEAGEAHIALSGTGMGDKEFVTRSNSTGSITVSGKKLVLKDLKLFNSDNQEKVVSCEIGF